MYLCTVLYTVCTGMYVYMYLSYSLIQSHNKIKFGIAHIFKFVVLSTFMNAWTDWLPTEYFQVSLFALRRGTKTLMR